MLLVLIRDKEYSLANGASLLFRSLSKFFSQIVLPLQADKLSLDKMFAGLVSLEHNEEMISNNLASLLSLLESPLNVHIVADFVRRNIVTLYLNPLLEFRDLTRGGLLFLSGVIRKLSENPQVSNLVAE